MAFQIMLRGFARTPVRGKLREITGDQRFDVRFYGLFVVEICADVADVRIREADDLAGIARVGENFLVARETGIENDFAATTGASARRATLKYATVFERENRAACERLRQRVLLRNSFRSRVHGGGQRKRSKVIHGPVSEDGFAINILPRHGSKHPRIIRAVAMIAHHEIFTRRNFQRRITQAVHVARRDV